MKDLDDGPDGLDDAAWSRAMKDVGTPSTKPRRARRRRSTEHALEQLIAAAHWLSPGLSDVSVAILPSGAVSVHVRTHRSDDATRLAADLGCGKPERVTDGRSEWFAAESGEYGDALVLSVTGGHRPVCQCHPKVTDGCKS